MEIRFFLKREDIWHFNIYIYTHQRRRTLWLLLGIYVFFILFASLSIYLSFSLVTALPWLAALIILPLFIVYRIRRAASQGAGWGGEHVVSITPEGMIEKTDQGEGIRNWSAIKTIDQDTYNLYFIVNASSSSIVMARIIPKRAFATPQDAEMFLSQARQYWMGVQQMRVQ